MSHPPLSPISTASSACVPILGAFALALASLPAVAGSNGTVSMPQRASQPTVALSAEASSALTESNRLWHGEARAALAERWYRWFESIPYGVVPHGDPSGANCGISQSGSVWFLSGPLGGTFTTACTIPAGKAIVSPVFNVIDDYPCPYSFEPAPGQGLEAFLQSDIANYVDPLAYATATLDGVNLPVERVKTKLFAFTAAASNVAADSCITGSPQLGVSDGYWVFIKPLPPGPHTLQLRSGASVFGGPTQVTINLTAH